MEKIEFIEEIEVEEKEKKVKKPKKEKKPKEPKDPKNFKNSGFQKTTKILIICISAVVLITIGILVWFFFFNPPKIETVYDRVVELVEESQEVNTVFYGAGLPVHKTNGDYAEFTHLYFGFKYKNQYEIVTNQSKFISTIAIREKAEQIYSKDFLEKVLYPFAFTGHAVDNVGGNVSVARYLDDEEWIYQSISEDDNYLKGTRIYDYSTMKVSINGNSKAFYVTMDSWLEESPEKVEKIRLRIVLQDGEWYLDSFTG